MEITASEGGYNYLNLKLNNEIINEQFFIVAESGWGKGLAMGGIAEQHHDNGFIVICIADPKDELELAYAMFPPEKEYHLNHLRTIGKNPSKKKVRLYHPFTFNIPKNELPDINFYTMPIKNLTRSEWSLLAETDYDTESIRLLMNSAHSIPDSVGLYGFLHHIQDLVKGKKTRGGFKPDPKNFFLEASSGTAKSVTEISTYLQPFRHNYFLASNNSPIKLDWKNILTDQEHYHVFLSNWIEDEKMKDFIVLSLFSQIIKNRKYLKKPVIILIPEVAKQTPYRPQGHKMFLSRSLKDNLSTIRSMGRGFSSICDTQVMSGVDEEVINRSTTTLWGQITGARDLERVVKSMGYGKDIRNKLKNMSQEEGRNSYLIGGKEGYGGFTLFFPSHMWAEPKYNFFEMYKKHYKSKMKVYSELINQMRADLAESEEKIRDKIKRKQKAEKEAAERLKKEKEQSSTNDKGVQQAKAKAQEMVSKTKLEKMKLVWEYKQDYPEMSNRELAKKFETSHHTIKKYLDDYEKISEKKQSEENSKDFQDAVLEDLDSDS